MKNAAQAYFKTGVSTVDQGQLLIMLYDGALKFLQRAKEKMQEKDYAAKGILISRVMDIINELSSALNMEQGGSLAENLNNLYFLCTTRLLQANLKMDIALLDSVADILSGLRSAYAEVLERPEARAAVARIAARSQPERSLQQRAAPVMSGTTSAPPSQSTAYYAMPAHAAATASVAVPAVDHAAQMAALSHTVSAAAAPGGPAITPGFVTEQLAPRMMQGTMCRPAAAPPATAAQPAVETPAPAAAEGARPAPRGLASKLAASGRIMGK